ncbi:MAG: hypothetical protein WCG27_06835, partial [Pseudomonadota bacterium]
MIQLKSYAGKTHQGPHLQVNEDCYEVDLCNRLYLVIDGIGGAGIGNRYSALFKDGIKQFYTRLGGDPDATRPFYFGHRYLLEGNALINSLY